MEPFEQAVQTAVKKIVGKMQIRQTIVGIVKNVRETTCDIERENAPTLLDCRLNAIDDNLQSFVTIYPKEGSDVIVGIIENLKTEAVVLRCSEVEKVKLKIGNQTLKIDKDGFVFNDGTLDGLVKIQELTNKLNVLVDTFNSHTHPFVGVAPTVAATTSPIIAKAQTFSKSDYENTEVKQ